MISGGTKARGLTVADLAAVLFTAMFLAAIVVSLMKVNSLDFRSFIAHWRS